MPDNAGYFHAAYIAVALIHAAYLFILGRRMRSLRDEDERPAPPG